MVSQEGRWEIGMPRVEDDVAGGIVTNVHALAIPVLYLYLYTCTCLVDGTASTQVHERRPTGGQRPSHLCEQDLAHDRGRLQAHYMPDI